MADDTPHPLGLILRMLDQIDEKLDRFDDRLEAHQRDDTQHFAEVRDILMSWRGAAAMAMIFVPAIVSLIVGLLVKYF